MQRRSIRRTALACLCLLGLALTAGASPAGATPAITATHISSPADGSYLLGERTGPSTTVTITGTIRTSKAIGEEEPEIRCYSSSGYEEVAEIETADIEETATHEYRFTVEAEAEAIGEEPCAMRVVPEGYSGVALPPGTTTPFEGPRVAYSQFGLDPGAYGFELEDRTLSSLFELASAGQGGLSQLYMGGALLSSPTLSPSAPLWGSMGALPRNAATRAAIEVDRHNAYDTTAARELASLLSPANEPPAIEVTRKFDPATGLMTIVETEPLVECRGSVTAYPETKQSCEELVSAGVSLQRTWTPTDGGRLITMSDLWRSTDGAEHTISADYRQELAGDATSPGSYQFPGGPQPFAPTKTGESIELAAPGAILYREDGTAAEAPGGAHPVGAIVLASPPGEPATVTAGSAETKGASGLTTPYSLTVGQTTDATVTITYAEGYTQGEVCALAETVKSGCQPSVSITSPAGSATTASTSITVPGTASDAVSLSSLTVDGKLVTVSAGAWSTALTLVPGTNTITAVATNRAGLTRTVTATVTAPTPEEEATAKLKAEEEAIAKVKAEELAAEQTAQREAAARAKAAEAAAAKQRAEEGSAAAGGKGEPTAKGTAVAKAAGPAKLIKGNIVITLACSGPAGGSCSVRALLTSVERLRAGRVSALAASTRTITIASATSTIPAGASRTITLRPNATGRALLARFLTLPLHLAVLELGGAQPSTPVTAQNLTILARRH